MSAFMSLVAIRAAAQAKERNDRVLGPFHCSALFRHAAYRGATRILGTLFNGLIKQRAAGGL
jgi:hypothetical protein